MNSWKQSGRNKSNYGGKDLWKRWVLSLEWKVLYLDLFIDKSKYKNPTFSAYSVKTKAPGAKPGGELTKVRNVHKSPIINYSSRMLDPYL